MDYTLAGTVILSGMSIVFVVLILLTLMMMAFGKIMDRTSGSKKNDDGQAPAVKEAVPSPAAKAAPMQIEEGISDEIIAVISASVSAMMGGTKNFVIKSVKSAQNGRSVWSMAGMQQNTNPF